MERVTDVLILNLDFLPDRLNKTFSQIEDTMISKFSVTRFSASNGFDLEYNNELVAHMKKYGNTNTKVRYVLYEKIMRPLQKANIIDPDYTGVIKPGTIGNYLSWYRILCHIIKNGNDLTLVLEDDIIIKNKRKFNDQFTDVMNNLPDDFDVLYFGTSNLSEFKAELHDERLMKIKSAKQISGLFAVLITRKCAYRLIAEWYPMKLYSDIVFTEMIDTGNLSAYHTNNDIIDVDYSMSWTASAIKEGANTSTHKLDEVIKKVTISK
jgi:GR25 family glycosyltransferase involved in LPS biosynthesis